MTKIMKTLTLSQSQTQTESSSQISTNDTKIKVIDMLHTFSDDHGKNNEECMHSDA